MRGSRREHFPAVSNERTGVRWHRRLTGKVALIGVSFMLLLGLFLSLHYAHLKKELLHGGVERAESLSDTIAASILTFVFRAAEGGALIDDLLERVNKNSTGVFVRMVHSRAINEQYVEDATEQPMTPEEVDSLADGTVRAYQTDAAFVRVVPLHAEAPCVRCHDNPDGPGQIPVGYVLGLVVTEVSKAEVEAAIAELAGDTLLTGGFIVALMVALLVYLSRAIVRPVTAMTRTIAAVADGDFGRRIELVRNDEIGELSAHFNTMSGRLKEMFDFMRRSNVELTGEVTRQVEAVRQTRDFYQAVVDSTQRIILTSDTDLVIDSVNVEWERQKEQYGLEIGRDELIGRPLAEFLPEGQRARLLAVCRRIVEGGAAGRDIEHHEEFDLTLKEAHRYFLLNIGPLIDSENRLMGLVFVATDISSRKRAEEMLRVERNKLNAIMDGMGDAVMIVEGESTVTYMNKLMRNTFGAEAVGQRCFEAVAGRESPCPGCHLGQQERRAVSSVEIAAANGRYYLATHTHVADVEGYPSVIGVYKDITFRKEMEDELRLQTITDTLTGLYNKRHFFDRLEREITGGRGASPLTLLFLDIDKFKSFNDTYGHVEGDVCLAALGNIVRGAIRDHGDAGFRYGGEEFTVLLPGAGAEQGARVADRIRQEFGRTVFTPEVEGVRQAVTRTVSIGGAVYEPGESAGTFVERADNAMYTAKRAGGDQVRFS
ncbi:MAG: diguanylate cyclase [Nitrospinae bacterium]|nr:diguanylate cyclase [Nitrospinota bacterium]